MNSTVSTVPSGSHAPQACPGKDVAASLAEAVKFQNRASSYRIDSNTSIEGVSALTILEVQEPDRIHVNGKTNGVIFEFIAIGATLWRKSAATWVVASSNFNSSDLLQQGGQLNDKTLASTTFTNVSEDANATLSGQPAAFFRFHETIPSEFRADVQFWLARDTCRPLKSISNFTTTTSGSTSTYQTTSVWSRWNAVTIQPPA